MDNFLQGGKYSTQIDSYPAEFRRERKLTDQKSLSIPSLQTNNLNIDSSSGCSKKSEREHIFHTNCTLCGGANNSAEKHPKGSEREKKIVWLVIWTKMCGTHTSQIF